MHITELDALLAKGGVRVDLLSEADALGFKCPACFQLIVVLKTDHYFSGTTLEDVTLQPKAGGELRCNATCQRWSGKVVDGIVQFC